MASDKPEPVFTFLCEYFQFARIQELNEDS